MKTKTTLQVPAFINQEIERRVKIHSILMSNRRTFTYNKSMGVKHICKANAIAAFVLHYMMDHHKVGSVEWFYLRDRLMIMADIEPWFNWN